MNTHTPFRVASPAPTLSKLVLATLVLTLCASQDVTARKKVARNKAAVQVSSQKASPAWTRDDIHKRNHIPPIIMGDGGSITFETKTLTYRTQTGLLPHVYTLGGYRTISRASVMELPEDGGYSYFATPMLTGNWQVRVWLEEYDGTNYVSVQESGFPASEPAIVVSSDARGLVIESRKDLGPCQETLNPERECKYTLTTFNDGKHLRIGKFQLVKSSAAPYNPRPFQPKRKVQATLWFYH